MLLSDKVALVTGASSGIGEATARRLAKEGASVGVLGHSADETRKVVEEIERDGGKATLLLADVADPAALKGAIDQLARKYGTVDIVIANAGVNGTWASLDELTLDDYDQTMDTNFKSTFMTVKFALPYLKRSGGAIVVTASVNGTRMFSNTGATIYACSKAAQVAFVKMTAIELAQDRIRINVVCPGAIETQIDDNTHRKDTARVAVKVDFPEGHIPLTGDTPGEADDVAQLMLFLVSDAAKHITGTEVWIDGGQSLLQG